MGSGGRWRSSQRRSQSSSSSSSARVLSLAHTVEWDELRSSLEQWVADTGEARFYANAGVGAAIAGVGVLSLVLGLFSVLIPGTYAVGGLILYRNEGWKFFQPGVGGRRFVALNGVAWSFYALSVLLQGLAAALADPLLGFCAFMLGGMSYVLLVGALFAYRPPQPSAARRRRSLRAPAVADMRSPSFNETLQDSALMRGDGGAVSLFWWVFVGMQAALVGMAALVCLAGAASVRRGNPLVRALALTVALWTSATACATSHALGGKWRHVKTNYAAFQPGKGGAAYVALQAAGWTAFSAGTLCGLAVWASELARLTPAGRARPLLPPALEALLMSACGLLGVAAEALIVASLFYYRDGDAPPAAATDTRALQRMTQEEEDSWGYRALLALARVQIRGMNLVFGPRDPFRSTRDPLLSDPDAHLACDARWEAMLRDTCPKTLDTYLVVGNGFVGRRIVDALLQRGEQDVRVFDIVDNNAWRGDPRVTFMRGDVTRTEDARAACEGVHTVFATFAIIRFMDRLEHQAWLSYHVNVTGTEVLLAACRAAGVARLVVTSSSHATTDDHSMPRFDRDESAPLLSRRDAHNHYGWTKAIADQLALQADDQRPGGMAVTVVRPCSGVFGADDRLSFEKILDMGLAPGVGAQAVMDWVPVQSVVQGHLLAERALQDGTRGVRGEAFCISNDDPTSLQDFWWLTIKYIRQLPSSKMRRRLALRFMYVPEGLLWAAAYASEFVQFLFRGKVSLGRDVDMLTPAMLSTVTMSYTYSSAKARRVLGYEPVFSLDEAIQRGLHEYYDAHFANAAPKKTVLA